jgi:thioredoxin-related protein
MKYILFLCYFIPAFVYSQEIDGIKFERELSWEQIKAKAKNENKYIFMDCYASWCMPCKKMDKEVYTNPTVGKYLNESFISVKVQLDSTNHDAPEIKNWYATAKELKDLYLITSMPTFLFFSSDGKIVHRDLGWKTVDAFINLAKNAKDSSKQYYVLIAKFRDNNLEFDKMPSLANSAVVLGDRPLALQIAKEYMHQYLDKLDDASFYTKKNLSFFENYSKMITSDDRIFKACFNRSQQINTIINEPNYSNNLIKDVITTEDITPLQNAAIKNGSRVDWKKITSAIKKKYGSTYATQIVLDAKPNYYFKTKNWKKFTKYMMQQVKSNGFDKDTGFVNAYSLNYKAWGIFLYSSKKRELREALKWVNHSLTIDSASGMVAAYLDTKANLLYKLGNKKSAMDIEEKAAFLAPNSRDIQSNFKKMKNMEPTWVHL